MTSDTANNGQPPASEVGILDKRVGELTPAEKRALPRAFNTDVSEKMTAKVDNIVLRLQRVDNSVVESINMLSMFALGDLVSDADIADRLATAQARYETEIKPLLLGIAARIEAELYPPTPEGNADTIDGGV